MFTWPRKAAAAALLSRGLLSPCVVPLCCSYLPNPKHTSPRAMEMLVFLGRLMGMSLRHKSSLPFVFPSIVWKPLVGVPLSSEDMMQVGGAFICMHLFPLHGTCTLVHST
jgi:hypothetical protein